MSEMSDLTAADWAAMRARCDKATPGPWIAERIDETSWRSVARCDGIHPAHNHGDDVMCYEADPECLGDTEIVTTDSGVYGPKWPDAEFIASRPHRSRWRWTAWQNSKPPSPIGTRRSRGCGRRLTACCLSLTRGASRLAMAHSHTAMVCAS